MSKVRKEHQDSKEQNRRKKRRKYSLIEEHWGEEEQKQVEEGANTEQLRPTVEQPEEQPTQLCVKRSPTNAAPTPPNPPSKGEQVLGYELRGAGRQARLTDYFVRAQTHDQPTSVAVDLRTTRTGNIEEAIGLCNMVSLRTNIMKNLEISINDNEEEHGLGGGINNVENPMVRGHVDNYDNNKLSTAPSVDMNVNSEVCKPDDRGRCMKHNCEMRKIKLSVNK